MNGLFGLAILILIGIPVGIIVMLVSHFRLKGRVGEMDRLLGQLRAEMDILRRGSARVPEERAAAVPPLPDAPAIPVPLQEATLPEPAGPDPAPAAIPAGDAAYPVISGPWFGGAKAAAAAPAAPQQGQDRPLVVSAERVGALFGWLRDNWVLAVAALSLALAGIFFVQYGVERGLLPPPLRVLAALGFGAALVFAGEWVRRRHGDEAGASAYIPSAFSGAGIVSMFGAVLAARQMYGLIGPEAAMTGLVAVALLALVLGWFHGPFLAATGLIGAAAAPFAVSDGTSENVTWLYGYFALTAVLGLGIDTVRRWAWVSVLSLCLATGAGLLLHAGKGDGPAFALMLTVLVLAAMAIPVRTLWLDHGGTTITGTVLRRGKGAWPSFPVRLAGGMTAAACVLLALLDVRSPTEAGLILALLAGLALILAVWAWRAPALADLALIPTVAFLARLGLEVIWYGPLYGSFLGRKAELRGPEEALPMTLTFVLALVAVMAAGFAARSLRGRDHPLWWAGLAVGLPPVAAGVVEMWNPANVLGPYPWALHPMALAGLMVVFAVAFARRDGEADRRRAAYATLSALTLIPFALFALLTEGALTIALAALVAVAVALDRRFRLPEMGWFIQAGCIVLGWRLFLDPGIEWALDARLIDVCLAFAAAIAACAAGLWLLRGLERRSAQVFLDSGMIAFAAVFADVLLFRWLDSAFPGGPGLHWAATLMALPWLIMMFVQLYRARLGGFMGSVRRFLAVIAGLIAGLGLAAAATVASPLVWRDPVGSLPVFKTLAVAYAQPGLIQILAGRHMPGLPQTFRRIIFWIGAFFMALYAVLEVRRFWQGPILSDTGMPQGELYSYTILMMAVGAGLIWQAIAKGSVPLRRIGMTVIALTIAKVFLIDAGGLTGLTRVAAFLGLGLSLAGLAWLNRWAAGQSRKPA